MGYIVNESCPSHVEARKISDVLALKWLFLENEKSLPYVTGNARK